MAGFSQQDVRRVAERVFRLTGYDFPGTITAEKGRGLRVDWQGGDAAIVAEDVNALARGCLLLARAMMEGRRALSVREERHFKDCGALIDCSRGAVMTVDACKRLIDMLAALGMNVLVLYTEDTYTVPEYPYLGHMRGRYTQDELREIDRYAAGMGVELIINMQTLAHMGQFLQWKDSEEMQDTQYCLLIDDENTYAFIDAAVRAISGCVASRRIHIGMDEANNVGMIRYYQKHGPVDRFDMLCRHLGRVVDICHKYGMQPMMWSDMFFRFASASGDYYDDDARIPERVLKAIPDVQMVYWDYFHRDEAYYARMFALHRQMGSDPVFAGAIWSHTGFLPNVEITEAATRPAMRACVDDRIGFVLATLWGDDGCETDYFLAAGQLPMYSEACWRGKDAAAADEQAMARLITRDNHAAHQAFPWFYTGDWDDRTGKGLIYCDLLYPLLPGKPDLALRRARLERGLSMLKGHEDSLQGAYIAAVFEAARQKAALIPRIRSAYQQKDRAELCRMAETDIPALLAAHDHLMQAHRALWEASYKRCGWEIMALRYGAAYGRMQDVARSLARYGRGELPVIEELEVPDLDATRRGGMQFYEVYAQPRR